MVTVFLAKLATVAVIVALPAAPAAANQIITGTDGMVPPHVKAFSGGTGSETASFFPYDAGFTGGVRVAVSDVTGDGVTDIITGVGDGVAPHVKAFSGADQSEVESFFAYPPSFQGGVYVAAGDVDGDGRADIITGAGTSGGTHVKVFSGATNALMHSFAAYPGRNEDVRVAAGDVNGDGFADIITAPGVGASGGQVKVFDGSTPMEPELLLSFFAQPAFAGGVYVAAGDVNSDGLDDIVTGAGIGGGTHVKVFNGEDGSLLHGFFAYGGADIEVRVGAGDVNGDGHADIITGAGPGAAAHVKVFSGDGLGLLHSYFAYPSYAGGIHVAGVTPVERTIVPESSSLVLASIGLVAAFVRRPSSRQIETTF